MVSIMALSSVRGLGRTLPWFRLLFLAPVSHHVPTSLLRSLPDGRLSLVRFRSHRQDKPASLKDTPDPAAISPLYQFLSAWDHTEVLGESTVAKFKYLKILESVQFLASRYVPLPESMTDEQIKTLANLRYIMPRTQFLMYLRSPEHAGVTLDEILASDERIHAGFDFTDQAMRAAAPPQMSPEVLQERWNLLREAYMSMRQEGDDVPFDIKPERLTDLLLSANESKMRSTLTFLHQVHLLHVKRLFRTFTRRVMARQSRSDAIREKVEQADGHIIYGLGQNTFNIRIANQTMDRRDEWRMIRQFQPAWGQSMVVDLQFLKYSYPRCLSSIYREIQFGIHRLKTLKGSFALYLCNFDPTCPKSQKIFKSFPKLREPHYPVVLTEKSYLELFPQKDLVYLSPDSKTDLKFNGDDVYIIGAQTSKSQDCPKTLSVAKKDGIRHARLPLRVNIGMRAELNIDHVMAMMAELQYSGDWIYASRWIPSRFFRNRIKSMGRLEPRDEAVYKAHNELNPSTNEDNVPMGPMEYRKKFKSILEQELIHPGNRHESVDLTAIMQPKERMSTPIFTKTPNSKGGKTSSYASKEAIATIFGE